MASGGSFGGDTGTTRATARAALLLAACAFSAVAHSQAGAPSPPPAAPATSGTGPAGAAPTQSFAALEYRVIGNTTLTTVAIERAVYPYLGPQKTIADVEAARQNLERAYRGAGYGSVFVDIPEQKVEEGVVRLRVTEGRLERVRVMGARYFSNGAIRAALPAVAAGAVLNVPALQSELAELNRVTADRVVVPVLKAGSTPGTVDIDLKVKDTLPVHGSLEFNNRYSPGTPALRVNGTLAYSNLFDAQQSLSLQYQTAPDDASKVKATVANYLFRIPGWTDATVALYAVNSKSDVAALGTLAVIGNGEIYGVRAIQSLSGAADYVHNLTFGIDYKDFLESIELASAANQITPVHYVNWLVGYTATLTQGQSTTDFNLSANFGVRRFINNTNEFANKRYQGNPDYFYVRGGATRLQKLPLGLELFGSLQGQASEDALVSNEQLAVGGADTVRGYLEANQLGDYGAYGTLELRQIALSQLLHVPPGAAYVLVFTDGAAVNSFDNLQGQISRQELASWGAGFRISSWHGLDLTLEWAHALRASSPVSLGEDRFLFDVRYGR